MTARAALIVGLLAALALITPLGRATERLGESPHGEPAKCLTCHAPGEGEAPGAPLPALATCRSCHPDADMHPVGMKPERVAVHEGWPLEDGVVTCATCHAEPGCDPTRSDVRPWLRGGTPERHADFCGRCHELQAMRRESPHLALGAPETTAAGCPACHTSLPRTGATVAEAELREPAARSCDTCHPGPAHAGAAEHLGRTQLGPMATELPLGPGKTIGCWTCHDVHRAPQPRPVTSALAASLARTPHPDGPEALLALPAADGSLCRACHGTGP
jgi:hypothetical protein